MDRVASYRDISPYRDIKSPTCSRPCTKEISPLTCRKHNAAGSLHHTGSTQPKRPSGCIYSTIDGAYYKVLIRWEWDGILSSTWNSKRIVAIVLVIGGMKRIGRATA